MVGSMPQNLKSLVFTNRKAKQLKQLRDILTKEQHLGQIQKELDKADFTFAESLPPWQDCYVVTIDTDQTPARTDCCSGGGGRMR